MKNNLTVTVVVAVIVAVAAFFGGMKYQQAQLSSANQNNGNGQYMIGGPNGPTGSGRGGRMGFGRNGNAAVGDILSQDQNSLTIKLADGSSKIIILTGSTAYSKTDSATLSDLKVGERVAAFGATNSDGSITATNVQLNPQFRNRPAGNNTSPTGTQ